MTSSAIEIRIPNVEQVNVSDDTLTVDLSDGRTISVPLAWYPRLVHGSQSERGEWSLIGSGNGIHWQKLDEDISVASILAGRPSGESEDSLRRWLESRASATST